MRPVNAIVILIHFVNAKLNLGLNIIRKRNDGYHELETVFYPVGLYNGTPENPEPFCDILEIVATDGDSDRFTFTGNPIDCSHENNLVCKAASAFHEALKETGSGKPCFDIRLEKHIPDGAGLGGGSADASFTLRVLNKLCGNPFDHRQLIGIAAVLGADCPFFIENRPVLASGIGEIMTPVGVNLEGYWAVIIKPDIYISTREAFSGIRPKLPENVLVEIIEHPVEEWKDRGLGNDFEPHIFQLYPRLGSIKESLYENGALYAAMSGSGSSLFGIFPDRESALSAKLDASNSTDYQNLTFISKL